MKGSSQLNRRSGTHQTGDQWKPLLWAAKENQRMVADVLLDHGFNVNEQEPTTDKSLSGYALPSAPSLTTSLPSLTTSSFFALPPPHPLGLLLSHTIGLPSPLILPRPSLAAPLLPPPPL